MEYGLIEYDGGSTPTVIIASSPEALDRQAVREIKRWHDNTEPEDYVAEFLAESPYPDTSSASPSEIREWLDFHWDVTTIPMFTRLEKSDVVVAV